MAITAADVNKLRQQTGAGMMDCMNALVEANGDFVTAIDIIRRKGQKITAKRGGNEQNTIPDHCPHCKNPNTKKIRLCEWCGNQIV